MPDFDDNSNSTPPSPSHIPSSGMCLSGMAQTMSSREIADLCDKRHDHVMRDIRDMLAQLHGETEAPKFGGYYIAENGKQNPCFNLPKRETLILVSGYNLVMRAKIIDRWQELEAVAPAIDVRSLPQLQTIALQLIEVNRDQSEQIASMAPKVKFAEQVAVAPDAISVAQAAKILDTGQRRLFAKLREWSWVSRHNEPYQSKIEAGLLDVKVGHFEHPRDGLKKTVTALVTGKGLARLSSLLAPVGTPA